MIILIILIIVLLLSLSLINKTIKKKDNILEDVKLQEETIKRENFAMMLQQSDGTYIEDTSSSNFPTNMKFNSELSGCIDVNGNKINGVLSYNDTNKLVTLQTNRTSYCYLYFDIKPSASNHLIENASSEELWQSTLEDDGYRFVGTNPDNYICFGTSDKSTCTGDTDKYMYRIIGIFNDDNGMQHAKLIKKEALNATYVWHSDNYAYVEWNNSDLYNGLNGSYFLTNASYPYMQDTSWTNKIATWNYTMTNTKTYESNGPSYFNISLKDIYLHELDRSSKISNVGNWNNLSTKISLMYASDYALSLGETSLNYVGTNDMATMKTGWMHISNNDSEIPSSSEWTMSRYGYDLIGCYAWMSYSDGSVLSLLVNDTYAVRPVFYLASDVEILGGTGTISDPYTIKN